MQTHFDGQLHNIVNATTRRIMKKTIWRVGKLLWAASTPTAAQAAKFSAWKKTSRKTSSEQNLQMNCWEGVLYTAYQCDAISKQKCINFYNDPAADDLKLRSLFGTQTQFDPVLGNIPAEGDILTFEDTANGNVINHVALYAGVYLGQHYVVHNLSYHTATTGVHMGGGFHFESLASLDIRYNHNLNIYYTQPFWEAGSPTHAYYNGL